MHVAILLSVAGVGQTGQVATGDPLRRFLQSQVQRSINAQAALLQSLAAQRCFQQSADVHDKMRCFDGKGRRSKVQGFDSGQGGVFLVDETLFDH